MSLPTRGAWIETSALRRRSARRKTSLPTRGAWIETLLGGSLWFHAGFRSPRGERGLKHLRHPGRHRQQRRRSPRGERGLKLAPATAPVPSIAGRSLRGERGLERIAYGDHGAIPTSLPKRGAWIETCIMLSCLLWVQGRSLRGSVDRNMLLAMMPPERTSRSPRGERGLKHVPTDEQALAGKSLPTRGAWIETSAAAAAPVVC